MVSPSRARRIIPRRQTGLHRECFSLCVTNLKNKRIMEAITIFAGMIVAIAAIVSNISFFK